MYPESFDDDATGTVFRDVLMLTLVGFVAMLIMLLPHFNTAKRAEQEHKAPGHVVIEMHWPNEIAADVDLWVKAPNGRPVGFFNPDTPRFNLLRDDRGADDDASGTAAILAMGAAFVQHPPKRTVLVLAFTAEEKGLLGSKYFVKRPTVPLKQIVANVNVEMIGRPAAAGPGSASLKRAARDEVLRAWWRDDVLRAWNWKLAPACLAAAGVWLRLLQRLRQVYKVLTAEERCLRICELAGCAAVFFVLFAAVQAVWFSPPGALMCAGLALMLSAVLRARLYVHDQRAPVWIRRLMAAAAQGGSAPEAF